MATYTRAVMGATNKDDGTMVTSDYDALITANGGTKVWGFDGVAGTKFSGILVSRGLKPNPAQIVANDYPYLYPTTLGDYNYNAFFQPNSW